MEEINSNIDASNFWEEYTAGLEKGRVLAYELLSADKMRMKEDEKQVFLSWAALNDFLGRSERTANEAPIENDQHRISKEMIRNILRCDPYK